jgi:hypothetical protein
VFPLLVRGQTSVLRHRVSPYDVEFTQIYIPLKTSIQTGFETASGDNGPQFIANDFKAFVREYGLTHVRTSPYYPQSNGKLERWHGSLKSECIRPSSPGTKEEAERRLAKCVKYYNTVRSHSAIGYITPADCLSGLSEVIGQERDRKLEAARKLRQEKRAASKQVA